MQTEYSRFLRCVCDGDMYCMTADKSFINYITIISTFSYSLKTWTIAYLKARKRRSDKEKRKERYHFIAVICNFAITLCTLGWLLPLLLRIAIMPVRLLVRPDFSVHSFCCVYNIVYRPSPISLRHHINIFFMFFFIFIRIMISTFKTTFALLWSCWYWNWDGVDGQGAGLLLIILKIAQVIGSKSVILCNVLKPSSHHYHPRVKYKL